MNTFLTKAIILKMICIIMSSVPRDGFMLSSVHSFMFIWISTLYQVVFPHLTATIFPWILPMPFCQPLNVLFIRSGSSDCDYYTSFTSKPTLLLLSLLSDTVFAVIGKLYSLFDFCFFFIYPINFVFQFFCLSILILSLFWWWFIYCLDFS